MRVEVCRAALLAGVAAILSVASPQAQATLITHTVGEVTNTEFYDDFEGGVVGAAPDNGANPGAWRVPGGYGAVADAVSPGAAQGSKYLMGNRPPEGAAEALFENGVLSAGTIHAEWMYYIPAGVPTGSGILCLQKGTESGSPAAVWPGDYGPNLLLTSADGGDTIGATAAVKYYSGGWQTGTTVTTNQWHKWALDANLDTATFTLKVDDGTPLGAWGFAAYTAGQGLDRLTFGGGNGGGATGQITYIDSVPVPEPSAMTLLGMGLFGFLAYAWRKRR